MAFTSGLFGAHVRRCSGQPATLAEVFILEGEPEVRNARFACGINQDVGGLDVPVDQPPSVGVMQCFSDRRNQFRRFPESRVGLSSSCRQVAPFDELRHDEAESVFGATHVMDRHDVGMVQPGEDACFDKERLDVLGLSDSFRAWHLDGYGAVEVVIVSEIDSSEPALTEPTDDPITPNFGGLSLRAAARILSVRYAIDRRVRPAVALMGNTAFASSRSFSPGSLRGMMPWRAGPTISRSSRLSDWSWALRSASTAPQQLSIARTFTFQDGGAGRRLMAFDGREEYGLNTIRVERHRTVL